MSETTTTQTIQAAQPETQVPAATETDTAHQERPYAILRIKRKRNEEPLDGLRAYRLLFIASDFWADSR